MKEYNNEPYIVSFTSFGKRFDTACKMIYSLSKQTYKNFHVVMTVYKEDLKDITNNMKVLIDNNFLEVIIAPENLCPHLKYFYAMKKYWDKPIITIDDDRINDNTLIAKLVAKYESLKYKSIVSACAPKMTKTKNKVNKRQDWSTGYQRLKANEVSYLAVAEGFAGVLYPPKCFKDIDSYLTLITECLYDDDICLKAMEIIEHIPVTQINDSSFNVAGINIPGSQENCLALHNNAGYDYRRVVTEKLNTILIKAWEL